MASSGQYESKHFWRAMKTKTKFWQEYLNRLGENAHLETLEGYQTTMREAQYHFEEAIGTFQRELSKIPIGAEIENWLRSLDLPEETISRYESDMLRLIDLGLLELVQNGQVRTLRELSLKEHQTIIEQIRCVPKLTIAEKEELVATYVLFSQHVSRVTCRLITQGENPDFQRTIKKIVKYQEFIKLVQLLPERDALIAKLLYFGAPTLDEVLNLKVHQIDPRNNMVKYNKFSMLYPRHVIIELKDYLNKKEKDDLIFVNLHGERVERTHLNNCFNRASRKISNNTRITPKMLLESDIANSVAADWPFASSAIQ
jgi:integrase